ncbi:MAG: UvrD-helicase domain-containing protein [Chitinispirillales bacterium]|jgi:DNA helicase-2/ATP-dependent DNA helicase PcrA|nr:UvrD-helicase domain-containing protein [Chitinispirillales bacterium]
MYDEIINSLNEIQKEAVFYDGGCEQVFAGAGTGKTKILTSKIAWLLKEKHLYPNQIFAATFTKKAANEMKERVANAIGQTVDGLWIGTFHSLCSKILHVEAEKIGFTRNFTVYDTSDQQTLMKSVMKNLNVDEMRYSVKMTLGMISSHKSKFELPQELSDRANYYTDKKFIELYSEYQNALKKANAMDFDDLLLYTLILFENNSDVLGKYQNYFRFILVDEYQDTNTIQFMLVKTLSGGNTPVFVVGDDDQSIYSWRGAQIENMLQFPVHFPNTKVFKLEQNYRSTEHILNFANKMIEASVKNRVGKKLWTGKKSDMPVKVYNYSSDLQEAQRVADEIIDAVNDGFNPKEIAILYRTNAQSRLFEQHLQGKVPYIVVGGVSFYERKEIKDILAYLKFLVNINDDVSFLRILNVPARGIGGTSQEKIIAESMNRRISCGELVLSGNAEKLLSSKAASGIEQLRKILENLQKSISNGNLAKDIIGELLEQTSYIKILAEEKSEEANDRIENIKELVNAVSYWQIKNPQGSVLEFIEEITLASAIDNSQGDKNAVNLMTFHSAKGLEFDKVFLVGIEDDILPSGQSRDDKQKIDEECRLFYVGITRARRELSCSFVSRRMRFGGVKPMCISSFLEKIPKDAYKLFSLVNEYDSHSSFLQRNNANYTFPKLFSYASPQNKEEGFVEKKTYSYNENSGSGKKLRVGIMVRHDKLGIGRVLNIAGLGEEERATILFNGGVRKQLMTKIAKLEIL